MKDLRQQHQTNLNKAISLGSYEENKEEWDRLEEELSISSVKLILEDSKNGHL